MLRDVIYVARPADFQVVDVRLWVLDGVRLRRLVQIVCHGYVCLFYDVEGRPLMGIGSAEFVAYYVSFPVIDSCGPTNGTDFKISDSIEEARDTHRWRIIIKVNEGNRRQLRRLEEYGKAHRGAGLCG